MGIGKLLKKVADPLKLHKKTTKLVAKTDPVAKKLMGTKVGKAVTGSSTKSSGKSFASSALSGVLKQRATTAATPKKPAAGSTSGRSLVNERRRMK